MYVLQGNEVGKINLKIHVELSNGRGLMIKQTKYSLILNYMKGWSLGRDMVLISIFCQVNFIIIIFCFVWLNQNQNFGPSPIHSYLAKNDSKFTLCIINHDAIVCFQVENACYSINVRGSEFPSKKHLADLLLNPPRDHGDPSCSEELDGESPADPFL